MKGRIFHCTVLFILFLSAAVLLNSLKADALSPTGKNTITWAGIKTGKTFAVSAKLAPAQFPKVKLNVYFIPQVPPGDWPNTKNCGQASVLNCVGYLKRACFPSSAITDENKWLANATGDKRYLDPNGWETSTSQLSNLAKSFWGYKSSIATTSTTDGLYNELKADRPVVVAVRIIMSSDPKVKGHFMALVGMDSNYVWVNDVGKSQGKDWCYSLQQFKNSWATQGNACVFIR